jgi:NAD(P)-dependent dehydrogenase (short-subunit alcohol dehydrogenase family)
MLGGEDLSIGRLFGVAGKVIVVTGGSKGIGLMIASGFVQNGARVYIFSRKPAMEAATALSARGPGSCVALQCDVADRAQIDVVAAQVGAAEPGGVHCLVNNSGATWGEPFDTTPKKSWDKLNAVNVVGLFETTQAFMPLLERSIADDDTGSSARVINIASIDGMRTPQIEEYAYTATKVDRPSVAAAPPPAQQQRAWGPACSSPPPPFAPCPPSFPRTLLLRRRRCCT